MEGWGGRLLVGLLALWALLCAAQATARGQTTPAPAASPASSASAEPSASPQPSATPRLGAVTLKLDWRSQFVSNGTQGSGQIGPEAAGFAAGSPVSPNTPYDAISSAPLTPGNVAVEALQLVPSYATRAFNFSATLAAGYVRGSTTTAAYWAENLQPALNPHLGSQALPYAIVFPTHAAQDDGTAFRGSIQQFAVGTGDGNALLRGGWFDLMQTDRFVFIQPLVTNVGPAIGMATSESLGNGPPNLDWWSSPAAQLPLQGLDFYGKRGLASLELTDASLPSLPGVGQRLTMGSFAIDHGGGLRYSAQLLHVSTGGVLVPTTILYGSDGKLTPSDQGTLPSSVIGGQRQTLLGLRAAFHAAPSLGIDGVAEYGRSWYDADNVALPGTSKPGNFYHLGFSHKVGRVTADLDLYRNEPRYADVLLPYGAPENVWSAAWAWPGQWLKSNYQLIDDTVANINRQGYRLRYLLDGGPLELHASFANFGQIDPITYDNARSLGFIDGFFLPQSNSTPTLGRQHQYGLWVAWHPPLGDLTFDYAEDTMHRDADPGQPADAVSYDAPQWVLQFAHPFAKRAIVAAGYARYAMKGSFGAGGTTNVDYHQTTLFVGTQFRENERTATLASLRRSSFGGLPSSPGGPSPAFGSTLLVIEQRVEL